MRVLPPEGGRQRRPVANARIACDGADTAHKEGCCDPVQCMWIEQSIAVDADQQLVPGKRRAGAERNGFAAVLREVDNTQPGYLARQLVQHFSGIVVTAVVDGDDLEGESSPKRIFPFAGKQCTISGIKDLADILDLAGARPHGRKLLAIIGGRGFYIRDLRHERVRTQHCARKSAHAVPIEKRYGFGSVVGLSLPRLLAHILRKVALGALPAFGSELGERCPRSDASLLHLTNTGSCPRLGSEKD